MYGLILVIGSIKLHLIPLTISLTFFKFIKNFIDIKSRINQQAQKKYPNKKLPITNLNPTNNPKQTHARL